QGVRTSSGRFRRDTQRTRTREAPADVRGEAHRHLPLDRRCAPDDPPPLGKYSSGALRRVPRSAPAAGSPDGVGRTSAMSNAGVFAGWADITDASARLKAAGNSRFVIDLGRTMLPMRGIGIAHSQFRRATVRLAALTPACLLNRRDRSP